LDRIRQMVVQAGLCIADIFVEAQHDALLLGLPAIEAGHAPDRERGKQHQRDAGATEISAGYPLLKPFLRAAQKVFKVGRPRSHRLRSGAPWSFRTGAPWASALILPRHRQSPPRRPEGKMPRPRNLDGFIGDGSGPYNASFRP